VDGLIFRFPGDARTAAKLEREIRLLPLIGPVLPVAIPQPIYFGRPDALYPYPFVGCRRLPGTSGETLRPAPDRWPDLARQFGAVLSALHSFPAEEATQRGIEREPLPEPRDLLDRVTRLASPIRAEFPHLAKVMEDYLSGEVRLPAPSASAPVVSHADLKGEHILLSPDGSRIAGIIDWTDIALCDPIVDFTGLMIWLGERFVRQVLVHYTLPAGEGFQERVRFYARCLALEQLGLRLTDRSAAPLPLLLEQLRQAFNGMA
jgi:aminoglycoside phosphotransferase (APT) family kinase protein